MGQINFENNKNYFENINKQEDWDYIVENCNILLKVAKECIIKKDYEEDFYD